MRFSSFIDKKNKEARKELSIIRDILSEGDMDVEDILKSDAPYLFLKNPDENLDFGGVRIYKIGSNIAYRIQKESKTEPYGTAYPLNIEDMFGDLITDMNEEKAAKHIKKAVIAEFKSFFRKSAEAQEKINSDGAGTLGKIVVTGGAGDLSSM